jgi:hypothetical protein
MNEFRSAVSDVFSAATAVSGLTVLDPPFRCVAVRNRMKAAMADENYGALTRPARGRRLDRLPVSPYRRQLRHPSNRRKL